MELDNKKLQWTSQVIYYSISCILSVFLILLTNKVIGDLDSMVSQPDAASFENKQTLSEYDKVIDLKISEVESLIAKKETIEKTISTAAENYASEKQSFDNWVETRKTLGSPDKDQEVISRAQKLDEYSKIEQEWRTQLYNVKAQISEGEKEAYEIKDLINKERELAQERYNEALKKYELKVFLIRLVFISPILALGIFLFIRYRRHRFWPIYFGFSLYSLYAFFFGLVPYLPSYGGYVRYSVGVVLSAGLGYYAIKQIRHFMELKQAELQISTQERAKKVQANVAEKALDSHFCPSCGKDFLLRKWEFPGSKIADTDTLKLVTTFCRHCGLELFKDCSNCGTKNFAHLPFCSSCGAKVAEDKS